jgi:hypothetical protein
MASVSPVPKDDKEATGAIAAVIAAFVRNDLLELDIAII